VARVVVMQPFQLCDCSLARCATGRVCTNLRELLESLRVVSDTVVEHHMMRCALEDHFELYEFPNDLARWSWEALGDQLLGEQLGLIDPYRHPSTAALRGALIDVVEERLWGMERVPWCRPGLELHLLSSRIVAYDTGQIFATPVALAEAIDRMSLRSLYFHVHEARRRTAGHTDDFSEWLANYGADPALVEHLRKIDFYALNLSQLRTALQDVFRGHLSLEPVLQKVTP
jgi:hypothetical protein